MYIRSASKVVGYSLVAFTLCFCSEACAQKWTAGVQVGYATYSYEELKDYQESVKDAILVPGATITDNFPAYVTYGVNVQRHFKKFSLGFDIGHGSSGGRVYYEDYSGRLIADQLVKYNFIGISPNKYFLSNEKMLISGGIKILYVMQQLRIRNSLTVGSQVLEENADFIANNLAIQPNVYVMRFFNKFFVQGSAGYEIQSMGQTKMKDDSDVYLDDGNGEPVHLKGDGLRLSLGLGIRF